MCRAMAASATVSCAQPRAAQGCAPGRVPVIPFRRRRLFIGGRVPLYHPDFPLILYWSQKAGCTTVLKWFFAQTGLLETAAAFNPWLHEYELKVYKAQPGYRDAVRRALRSGAYRVVKVVRDPAMRAPSAFLVLAERGALNPDHWVAEHWQAVDAFLARRGRDPAEGLSFLDHLDMVAEHGRRGAADLNLHIAAQHLAGEETMLDEVVPIERFAAWTATAPQRYGVSALPLDVFSESRHHHTVDPDRTRALGERPETVRIVRAQFADGRFPAGRVFLNARSLPLVRRAFAADFDAYGELYAHPSAA